MEYTDIFRQLLQTEAAARTMQEEAQAFGTGMAAQLEKIVDRCRKQAYEKAEFQIAQAEQEAIRRAEHQIARLDEDTRRHLTRLRKAEAQNRDSWVEQIYLAATCQE